MDDKEMKNNMDEHMDMVKKIMEIVFPSRNTFGKDTKRYKIKWLKIGNKINFLKKEKELKMPKAKWETEHFISTSLMSNKDKKTAIFDMEITIFKNNLTVDDLKKAINSIVKISHLHYSKMIAETEGCTGTYWTVYDYHLKQVSKFRGIIKFEILVFDVVKITPKRLNDILTDIKKSFVI